MSQEKYDYQNINYDSQGDSQGVSQGDSQGDSSYYEQQGYVVQPNYQTPQPIYITIPSENKSNFGNAILIFIKILIFLIILGVLAGIIYGMYLLYTEIKGWFTSAFGTQSVELNGVCTTHNDCIGWKPATAGTPGCCTANGVSAGLGVKGICTKFVTGALGIGYCPKESPW